LPLLPQICRGSSDFVACAEPARPQCGRAGLPRPSRILASFYCLRTAVPKREIRPVRKPLTKTSILPPNGEIINGVPRPSSSLRWPTRIDKNSPPISSRRFGPAAFFSLRLGYGRPRRRPPGSLFGEYARTGPHWGCLRPFGSERWRGATPWRTM